MSKEIIPIERIAHRFSYSRQKVMLDSDLAALYGVTTGNLNKAVKRNAERFPPDFMFQLTLRRVAHLKFQFGISKREAAALALRLHRTRRRHALERTEQRARRESEHRHHACVCELRETLETIAS